MPFLLRDNSRHHIQLSTNYRPWAAEASFKTACILSSRDASLACRISVPRKQCMPRGHKQVGLLQVTDDRCHGWLNAGYRSKACCWAHLSSPNADTGRSPHKLLSPVTRASAAPHPRSRGLAPGGHLAMFCDDFLILPTGSGNFLFGK